VKTYKCKCTLEHLYEPLFIGISSTEECERIVTMSRNIIKIWNAKTYECIHIIQYQKKHVKGGISIRIHNDKIIAIFDDYVIKVFSVITGKCDMVLAGHTDEIFAITIMPDGKIASSSRDKNIRIWDLDDVNFEDKPDIHEQIGKIAKCEIISLDLLKSNENSVIWFLKILPDGRLIGYSLNNVMIILK
jgi:WD40 repeat protein